MLEYFDLKSFENRMKGVLETVKKSFASLRTGRASPMLLDNITVSVYGQVMPINQVCAVSVPEPRMLSVSVWDANNVDAVERAILQSGLGLNPIIEGSVLRLPIPDMTQERRLEMKKLAGKYAEQNRIAIRNIRRDGMDQIKKAEKSSEMSKDEAKEWSDKIQSLTDKSIKSVDQMLLEKENEIMQV